MTSGSEMHEDLEATFEFRRAAAIAHIPERLALTAEQEEVILQVLQRNHVYYMAQGMSRGHMWPEELLSEVRNELDHRTGRNRLHRRPEVVEITDPETLQALQAALEMVSNASPNCCEKTTAMDGPSDIR